MNVIHKIDSTVSKYNMLQTGDTVAVGVSGGKDSMLLLNYLLIKKEELNLKLIVLNVEHGIRGEDSVKDSEFVRAFCESKDVEFHMLKINAPLEAKECGLGTEEYSRNRRYEFFASFNADKIATAHSMSDNAETLIFRLVRGTSLKGMCGIPPVRDNIIRPLIECSSEEIIEGCKELNISYVTDKSNFDNDYSRNKIRNEIIPLLESLNPQAQKAISRFSQSASLDEAYLREIAKKSLGDTLSVNELKFLNPSILKRAIEMYAEGFGVTLDEVHLNGVCELLNKQGKHQIKGTLFAFSDGEKLCFYVDNNCETVFNIQTETVKYDGAFNKSKHSFFCDSEKISGEVFVRSRQEGDSITLANRNCTKSLKKLYNELKIPAYKRNSIPVICDNEGVIGVYGYALSERVKADKNTKDILIINIQTEDKLNEG